MKVIEHYFSMELFIMLYKVVKMSEKLVTIQMKATELYFHVVLFIILHEVDQIFDNLLMESQSMTTTN